MSSILGKVTYFSQLPEELLLAIQNKALKQNFNSGQMVVLEGENNGDLYIIESGWMKVAILKRQRKWVYMSMVGLILTGVTHRLEH